ncbi:UDP-Glycosyltransferase/glycogen phosphorylase, partial [Mycena epipterygia]
GHIRPLCPLAARLVIEPNIIVTLFMPPNWLEQVRSDVAAQFPSGHEALERIRVVSIFNSTETQLFALVKPMAEHYPAAYETLSQGEAIKCATTGKIFAAAPRPSAVIMDLFGIQQLRATRAITGASVPILTFIAGNAGSLIRLFGPESMGGLDFGAQVKAGVLRTGISADEVGDQMLQQADGKIVKIPGIPAMYDYESFPQNVRLISPLKISNLNPFQLPVISECDGIFLGTSPAYDGESLTAFETWVTGMLHKPVYAVGPLLPPEYGVANVSVPFALRDTETKAFLDAMQSQYGERSVLFISFGTVFWPTVKEQLEELVDSLIEKKLPFILCHASPFATVDETLVEKIQASGVGIANSWFPQHSILNHPATGWFMTHAGHGGIMESLASGIPMICWPFAADQPLAAEHLTQNLDVAFHLTEVRTGLGLKPMHSGQVPRGTREAVGAEFRSIFGQCQGAVGMRKRKKCGAYQERIDQCLVGGWIIANCDAGIFIEVRLITYSK